MKPGVSRIIKPVVGSTTLQPTSVEVRSLATALGRDTVFSDGLTPDRAAELIAGAACNGRLPVGIARFGSIERSLDRWTGSTQMAKKARNHLRAVFYLSDLKAKLNKADGTLHIEPGNTAPVTTTAQDKSTATSSPLDLDELVWYITDEVFARKDLLDREIFARIDKEVLYRIDGFTPMELLRSVINDFPRGTVTAIKSAQHETDLHFPVTQSTPIVDGEFQMPHGENVVIIYSHGSGLVTSHGGNFGADMSKLAQHGIASIGYDMPYHRNGPTHEWLDDPNAMAEWMDGIVNSVKHANPGAKILLVGHCSGALMNLGYLSRYPNGADAAINLAPAGRFLTEMAKHHPDMVNHLFGEDGAGLDWSETFNAQGSLWIDALAKKFDIFRRRVPSIPMWTIFGADDISYPKGRVRAIAKLFARHYGRKMRVSVVDNIGHQMWDHRVDDINPRMRNKLFAEQPTKRSTRFTHWAIIDYLRNQLGLKEEIPPSPKGKILDTLTPAQRALLLYKSNPLFHAIIGEKENIQTDRGARNALQNWENVKLYLQNWLIKMGSASGFEDMESQKFCQEHYNDVRAYALALKEGSADALKYKNRLIHALMKFWGARKDKSDRPINIYSTEMRLKIHEAQFIYRVHFERSHTKNAADIAVRMQFLSDVRQKLGLKAKTVLSVGNGYDLMMPFNLFQGTERVVVMNTEPFDSPDKILSEYLNWSAMVHAHRSSAFNNGYDYHKSWRESPNGGEFLNRIMMGLEAKAILDIHYFKLGTLGSKERSLMDSSSNIDEFPHVEIVFLDRHGVRKTLEVIYAHRHSGGDTLGEVVERDKLLRYLILTSVDGVFAGQFSAFLETDPETLAFYHEIMEGFRIPWVQTDKTLAAYFEPDKRFNSLKDPLFMPISVRLGYQQGLPIFLNHDTVKSFNFSDHPLASSPTFPEGDRVYVAYHQDFNSYWEHTYTLAFERDLARLAASPRRSFSPQLNQKIRNFRYCRHPRAEVHEVDPVNFKDYLRPVLPFSENIMFNSSRVFRTYYSLISNPGALASIILQLLFSGSF
jgi:pimeloyl-ACP methyl ester carboxylesterase